MTNTTEVLTAAAASESVFFIPHFESIAVIPANRAENIAANIHISAPVLSVICNNYMSYLSRINFFRRRIRKCLGECENTRSIIVLYGRLPARLKERPGKRRLH